MAFGEILKQKRIELGFTKEYVCERTRLMARVIDALEAEDTKRIPSPLYGRGFIRLYCELLNIDPQPLIADYTKKVGGTLPTPVSYPAIHDIPVKPLEPIHTGGRRTMPPPKIEEERPVATTHKLVQPAEATFTSVPKPEVPSTAPQAQPMPTPSPQRATTPIAHPSPEPNFDSDSLPLEMPSEGSVSSPTTHVEKPAVLQEKDVRVTTETRTSFGANPAMVQDTPVRMEPDIPTATFPPGRAEVLGRPRKDVSPLRESTELKRPKHAPKSSIFGPQHPVPDPPNPQLGTIRAMGTSITAFFQRLFHTATRPHVERRTPETRDPLLTKRALLRSCIIFGVLVLLTLLVLSFRYVFQISADAEAETPLSASATTEAFSLRPVAEPPVPYFK